MMPRVSNDANSLGTRLTKCQVPFRRVRKSGIPWSRFRKDVGRFVGRSVGRASPEYADKKPSRTDSYGLCGRVWESLALPRGERQFNYNNSLDGSLGNYGGIDYQSILGPRPKPQPAPLCHSVYLGRRRLGRYERIGKRKYVAYDSNERLLGCFTGLAEVRRAFDQNLDGSGR
jgi:hypothetical protein